LATLSKQQHQSCTLEILNFVLGLCQYFIFPVFCGLSLTKDCILFINIHQNCNSRAYYVTEPSLWECQVRSATGETVHIWQTRILSHKLSGSKYLFVIQRKEKATFLCHVTIKRKFQFVSFHFKENCRSKSHPEYFNDHSRQKSKQFKYPHMGFKKCSECQFYLLLGFPNGWFPTGFP
jgi:hypothetical protein